MKSLVLVIVLIANVYITNAEAINATQYPANCVEAIGESNKNGIYKILIPEYSSEPFEVFCGGDSTHGRGWIVILRREDGSVNFERDWESYKKGFGDLDCDFFIGMEKLYAITAKPVKLLIALWDFDNGYAYQTYEKFAIGSEREWYALQKLGASNGTAGDSLSYAKGAKFATVDYNNGNDCPRTSRGAWWYVGCHMG